MSAHHFQVSLVDLTFSEFFDLKAVWSLQTFGPGARSEGVCRHIEKELIDIREHPKDISEWVDVVLLAMDGAHRAGFSGQDFWRAMIRKHAKNMNRKWSEPKGQDEPIEHVR